MPRFLVDIQSHEVTSQKLVLVMAAGVLTEVNLPDHDDRGAHKWHVPRNEREYHKSPQKALWRSARELKGMVPLCSVVIALTKLGTSGTCMQRKRRCPSSAGSPIDPSIVVCCPHRSLVALCNLSSSLSGHMQTQRSCVKTGTRQSSRCLVLSSDCLQ